MTLKINSLLGIILLVTSMTSCMTSYDKALRKMEKEVKELQKEYDVVIPIEERVPEKGHLAALNSTYGSKAPGVLGGTSSILKAAIDTAVMQGKARKVHVYVLDTAPDVRHPSVKDIGGSSKVFVTNDSGTDGDSQGHGTHCLGIVGGIYPGKDIPVGVAAYLRKYDLLTLHAGQVLSDNGSGSFTWIKNGLLWAMSDSKAARDKGEFVIVSMSLGANTKSTYLDATLKQLKDAGILVVAANGNTGTTPVNYPGSSPYTWGVAALTISGTTLTRATYSSFGPETYISALGSSVWSSYKNNEWATLSGTSMATPGIAGAAALLAAIYPELTVVEMERMVEKYSRDAGEEGRDKYYGYGVPFIPEFVSQEVPDESEPAPPTPDPNPDPNPERPEYNNPVTVEYVSPEVNTSIIWTERGGELKDTTFVLPFKLKATFTSKTKRPKIMLDKAIQDYYKNRFIVLPGSRNLDTKVASLYYSIHFLEHQLIKVKDLDFRVDCVTEQPSGIMIQGKDLPNLKGASLSKIKQKSEGVVTYTGG